MAIERNHTIVPAHDKVASAKFLARILGLSFDERAVEYFAPVRINDTLTLDFDDDVDHFDIHHYAFHVSDQEFDDILKRVLCSVIYLLSVADARVSNSRIWPLGSQK